MSTHTGTAHCDGTTSPSASRLLVIASVIAVAFLGSVLVTPLYFLYQRKLGFSEITLTLIYAVYVVGNVIALLAFGEVSDQIGRKRVAVPALALAAVSALLFLSASTTVSLYLGRLLIGLAVGVTSGTGTAWLAEHAPAPLVLPFVVYMPCSSWSTLPSRGYRTQTAHKSYASGTFASARG